MTTIGAFDAKTHLNKLLTRVSKGETISGHAPRGADR